MKIMDILPDKFTKYKTWEKDGVLMCSKKCCGAPVSECTCDSSCKHCNCYELKESAYSNKPLHTQGDGHKKKKVSEKSCGCGSSDVVEAIPKSTMYGLVIDGKYVAKGSKADMRKLQKEKGGTVYNAPGKKVGDSAGTVKERYGMRQAGVAQNRDATDDAMNMNKRMANRAADASREANIKVNAQNRRAGRLQRKIATGLPQRILNPQQPQAPRGQG